MSKWTPWHHQQYSLDKLLPMEQGLDFSDPGTGKTATHLGIFDRMPNRGRLLVSCPSTLMRAAWAADAARFFPHLTVAIADAKNRFEAFETKSDVVIVNTDGVKALTDKHKTAPQLRKFLQDFNHFVIDESTVYKHQSTARSKAAYKISRTIPRVFCLSGTPNPISVTELWHQVMLVDNGKRLGTSFYRFRNAMQESLQTGPRPEHLTWTDRDSANELVMYMLQDILVRHEFEEVMTDVPANHVDYKWVDLPPKLMRMYKQLETEMSLLTENGEQINAVHAAALRTKLLQLCSGAIYDGAGNYIVLDPFRYQMVADLVEERQHSVTFFNWKHQKDQLSEHFNKRGISFALIDGSVPDRERPKIVEDYQAGRYQTLLLHPKTGAHGLTLTRGTTSILTSPMYEADYFKQTIHRIYRGGQTEITNTLLTGARGTVEELVYSKLMTKGARMQNFLALVAELKRG